MTPEITVVIATHNRPELLREAVLSVRAQSGVRWELIVVDDASCEPASDSLQDLIDDRINVLRHETANGVSAARNAGLEKASAPFVAFLDDDDRLFPDYGASMVRELAHLGDGIACAWPVLRHMNASGETLARCSQNKPCLIRNGEGPENAFSAVADVRATGFIARTSVLRSLGGFDERFAVSEDRELLFRLLSQGYGCARVAAELVAFRVHTGTRLSAANARCQAETDARLAARYQTFLSHHPKLRSRFLNRLARRQHVAGDHKGAFRTLHSLIRSSPANIRAWRRRLHWGLQAWLLSFNRVREGGQR